MHSGLVNKLLVALCVMTMAASHAAPLLVAHRAGTGDAPENTLLAVQSALANGADMLWITVQMTSDGVPVLYRPADVSALTEGKGALNSFSFLQLAELNAGHTFSRLDAAGNKVFPYREQPVRIPTLQAALQVIPKFVPILLDMKQLPAAPLVASVAKVLDEEKAWDRVRIYSTEKEILTLLADYREARVFESRDATRQRLSSVALSGSCETPPAAGAWVGMELERTVTVVEKFTLGEGRSEVKARWWTPAAVSCFKTNPEVKIIVFGVDSSAAYQAAEKLGVDHVMSDSPIKMKAIRAAAR
ncbi:glycerophosphodiester phosphodiesterase family protein [Iodobacter sp.]|uniref:glycerophosphodiester phosphodiesterase family protein n=1 Tax=Iodobacter sp. TaxID=1915058 RepID=UPI0025F3A2CC|nr:glycerophosphodiester phosphodiesterase family protein [Iodobacter sp.]